MTRVYSTYEAKSRFSEILRQVREGHRVRISYRGEEVAEIGPIEERAKPLEERLADLERQGVLIPAKRSPGALRPIADRPGALRRFLESRD
jgi:prevent-host-death family protein